jgi:hypothetical protein
LASHRNTRPAQGSVITVETSHADARDADDAPADTTRCSDSRERAASEYMADETAGNEALTVIYAARRKSGGAGTAPPPPAAAALRRRRRRRQRHARAAGASASGAALRPAEPHWL